MFAVCLGRMLAEHPIILGNLHSHSHFVSRYGVSIITARMEQLQRMQPYIDQARRFVLDRMPQDRNSQLLLSGGSLTVARSVLVSLNRS